MIIFPAGSVLEAKPVYWVLPRPTATNPKLPNEEFEFVRSHCAPVSAYIAISQLIVKMETNCAYALLVSDTPMPASLYCVNESHTIDFKSFPESGSDAVASSPLIFIPILPVIKLVQLRTYGDLHLPEEPSVAGPTSKNPLLAWTDNPASILSCDGGNATAPEPSQPTSIPVPTSPPAKLKFSTKQPRRTWITSSFLFCGIKVTSLRSSPVTDTSVLRPTGLFSIYFPGLILIVSPSCATAAAPPRDAFASPSSNPLLRSLPFLVTQIVLLVCTPGGLHDTPVPTEDNR